MRKQFETVIFHPYLLILFVIIEIELPLSRGVDTLMSLMSRPANCNLGLFRFSILVTAFHSSLTVLLFLLMFSLKGEGRKV